VRLFARRCASTLAFTFTSWRGIARSASVRLQSLRLSADLLRQGSLQTGMLKLIGGVAIRAWRSHVERVLAGVTEPAQTLHARAQTLRRQNLALRAMSRWKGYTTRRSIGKSTCALATRMLRKKRMEATIGAWKAGSCWERWGSAR
jgi:hypothetical protein